MKTNFHPYAEYQKVIGVLIFILIALISISYFVPKSNIRDVKEHVKFIPIDLKTSELTNFNPNDYTQQDWISIGFTENQAKTILKYKGIVGGEFTSKEQLKKCYSISEEKFYEIEKFLLLPNKTAFKSSDFKAKKINLNVKFNPNLYSKSDWQNLGFSEKQAESILKYKNYLGGSFKSKEDIKNCFIINDETYKSMAQYLLLPEKTTIKNTEPKLFTFDPNTLNAEGWQKLGFSEKQTNSILNYRDKILKGSFKNLDDIKKCYMISDEKFKQLKPYISLSTPAKIQEQETNFASIDLNKITFKQLIEFGFDERAAGSFVGFRKKLGGFANTQQMLDTYNIDKDLMEKLIKTAKFSAESVTKYTLIDAPEDWLKNHPYFKYSADKIIFYRTSYQDENKIWKALKLKPEYETKMRWYLK